MGSLLRARDRGKQHIGFLQRGKDTELANSDSRRDLPADPDRTGTHTNGIHKPGEDSSEVWLRSVPGVKLSRAQALRLLGGSLAGATLGGLVPLFGNIAGPRPSVVAYAQSADNPIVIENQQAGSSGWRIPQTGYAIATDGAGQIKGYASATSVNKGEQITFYVSVKPAQTYTIDIYRMGWYGGQGGRRLQQIGPLGGVEQTFPTAAPEDGLIDCRWSPSHTLTVPTNWTDGIYLAVLTNAQKYQNYIMFVVRDDARTASLLYQQPVTTYQAYNNYPDDGRTGKSLYDYNSYGANTTATGVPRAAKVSFNRPYDNAGAALFYQSWNWERYFVSWIERLGYDVTYSTNHDTQANAARLRAFKGFVSVGHDEYWSKQMRDNVEAAREAGVHLAFFGANACYWQVRFEPSATGVPDRTLVCYKEARDPVQDQTTTVLWRDPLPNRPEQSMIGVQFTSQTRGNQSVPYVVINSSHWVYEGTGFRDGDQVAGLVGYEADRNYSEYPQPQSTGLALLSRSPYTNYDNRADYANSSIYKAGSGAWVFGAGTLNWSNGLDAESGGADARIQRTTKNILDTFVGATTSPPQPGGTTAPTAPSNLTAATGGNAKKPNVRLQWQDNSNNETSFIVERATNITSPTPDWAPVPINPPLAANTTSYTDTGLGLPNNRLSSKTTYYYRVSANNAVGPSGPSNTASVTTR